jgi:hypothetical protein
MKSWQLFRHLTPFRASELEFTPIFQRERKLTPLWGMITLPPGIGRVGFPAMALAMIVYLLALVFVSDPLVTYCLSTLAVWPLLLLPSLVLWTLPLGLTLAPVVVRERAAGTWFTLRTTPFDTETILLSKARAALLRLKPLMILSRGALAFGSLIAAMASLNLVEYATHAYPTLSPLGACGVGTLVMVVSAVVYLIDRAQQFVFMVTAALAASVSSTSARATLPGANAAAFLAWLADMAGALAWIAVHPGGATDGFTATLRLLVMLGPAAGYMAYLTPGWAVLGMLLTFVFREIAVRLVWRWTVRAARVV